MPKTCQHAMLQAHARVRPMSLTRTSLRWVIAASIWTATALAAQGQENVLERSVKGPAGKDIRLAVYASIKPDCTAGQLPTVRLAQVPAHGTVTVKQARMRTTNFKQCLAAEVPAFVALYRPSTGFTGEDIAILEVVTGQKKQLQRFKITVEKGSEKPSGQAI